MSYTNKQDQTERTNDLLLQLINKQYFNKDHAKEVFQRAVDEFLAELYKKNTPQSNTFQLGTQPFVLDYKNRRHIFVYNYSTASVTLAANDGQTVILPPQVWSNMGFNQGTSFNTTATTLIEVKCTDEVIP
jgi:hypothetical protein